MTWINEDIMEILKIEIVNDTNEIYIILYIENDKNYNEENNNKDIQDNLKSKGKTKKQKLEDINSNLIFW